VVTYSGDKLLGGPQAGMLSGAPEYVARIRANPLFRALRVDKLTYAALEATLMAYLRQEHESIPAVRMMRLTKNDIARRARELEDALRGRSALCTETVEGTSLVGGGAAPGATLPTVLLAVTAEKLSADELAARLRAHDPPIIARVEEAQVLLDLRTVFPEQDAEIVRALQHLT
jgi:L-seryl-tRNA(Ser) seleniumtransferase